MGDQKVKDEISKKAMLGVGNAYRATDASLLAIFLSDFQIHKRIDRIIQLEKENNTRDGGYISLLPILSSFTIDDRSSFLSSLFKKMSTDILSNSSQPMPNIESIHSWSYK